MAGKQLSDRNTGGTILGQDATDKVGFFGKAPATQPTAVATAAALATAAAAAVNAVITRLRTLGLIAS
jgi:hypothetical protein